nr:MAG TPA: Lower collar protein [Caudoviricetes sp.]
MIQARYTEVLYNLLKNNRTKQLINEKMSTYPLYVSTSQHEYGIPNIIPTREELNNKILNYYKYREIGFETVGRFLDELEISLNEIMPKYNQLFFSADQDYNIIYNVDYKRTIDRDLSGNTSSNTQSNSSSNTSSNSSDSTSTTTNSTSWNKNVNSDTPQDQLSITNKQIDSVNYANNVSWNKDDATQSGSTTGSANTSASGTANTSESGTGTNKEIESTLETTKGNFGVVSAQDLIEKYRKLIINIEQMIINDPRITELFMLVY